MYRTTTYLLLLAVAAYYGLSANSAVAAFITPAGVLSTSEYNSTGDASNENMINGSGLSAPNALATHAANNDLWHAGPTGGGLSGGPGSTGTPPTVNLQQILFNLGGWFDLTNAYIWNANQPLLTGRGVKDFTIQYSADNLTYSAPAGLTLNAASGTNAETAQTLATAASNVRYVRFNIANTQNGLAAEYVGLSEVRFEGTALPDNRVQVNVDFNGRRDGDDLGSTYEGAGAGGSGTYFNSVIADSRSGFGNDNQTITASNLLASDGVTATTVGFSINSVGGDNNGAPSAPNSPTTTAALYGDYVFSSGNPGFTISGLTPNSLVDLYFYVTPNQTMTVTGETPDAFVDVTNVFNESNTEFFRNVLVSGTGTVSGILPSSTVVLYGLSVVYAVPEPSSFTLLTLGAVLVCRRRRV